MLGDTLLPLASRRDKWLKKMDLFVFTYTIQNGDETFCGQIKMFC